jgi:hypothetical protein
MRYGQLQGAPAGAREGFFLIETGCTWLKDKASADVWSVFWPPDAHLDGGPGFVRVIVGHAALVSGDLVTLGGGEYRDETYVKTLVGVIPPACRSDLYWLATGVLS